jgi:hypothetical protein
MNDIDAPRFTPLPMLDQAWSLLGGGSRLEAAERAAPALRDAIASSGTLERVRTLPISSFPYPTDYAFFGACSTKLPYVWLFNRCVFVEYKDSDGNMRRLLINPTFVEGSRRAPYFREIDNKIPKAIRGPVERVMRTQCPPVTEQLKALAVDPASIDFITFDHLHVQDLRPMLGPGGQFPRAKLLATRAELEITTRLHPLQRRWYVEDGMAGVSSQHLIAFDRDILLGRGVALVRTPGHTDGNHTIVLSLPEGLVTISECGVSAECYAPEASRIPGLAAFAKRTGLSLIMNSNTRERSLDQYTSMRIEAILSARTGQPYPRHFSSSELTAATAIFGVKPTTTIEAIEHG